MSLRLLVFVVVLALARGVAGQDGAPPADTAAPTGGAADADGGETAVAEATVVDASTAADHVGEECVVEMVVRAARLLEDKQMCFLNTREDRREADNFTVVIFRGGLARFREADIENPADHFRDRTIRVRGVVAEHKGQPQIVVEDPEQIELVEEPAAAAADPE